MTKSILLFLAGVLVGANAVFFLLAGKDTAVPAAASPTAPAQTATPGSQPPPATSAAPMPSSPVPETVPAPIATPAAAAPSPALPPAPGTAPATTDVPAGKLLLPVAGVTVAQLSDTFNAMRGSDRRHEAIDILAPRGTPVLAVADGKVEKLFNSQRGGLTLYQFDRTGTFAYYYAHLDRYAPGMTEGRELKRGDVLGYAGTTGNADPTAPQLHFAVFQLGPEKRWWQGTAINPYPLLGGQ